AEQGAYEAIMIMSDGTVSEGSSSNVWILTEAGQLITRQANETILNGITRRSIQRIAAERQLEIVERPFTVDEMMTAEEVFVTSATSMVTALTQIDDRQINHGTVGLIASALKADYIEYIQAGE
ncbi:MAG: aminotransferase class IV, partial [Pseudomonadota bacterium]|nr:aminotransferase class IV [Pseudomonadota bacterium]